MSKNITIQEGGVARTLSGVEKIVTNVVGGGTQNWVPEDEAANYVTTGELSVSENGTYYASDDGYVGYSEVTVNTPSRLTTKSITENGSYDASDDGFDGYSSVDVNISGEATLIEKTITQDGTYNARDDNADGYSKVIVDTSGSAVVGDYYYPWTEEENNNAPNRMYSGGITVFNGKIHVVFNRLHYYLDGNTWVKTSDELPSTIATQSAGIVTFNNTIYLIGAGSSSADYYDQMWRLNGTTWERVNVTLPEIMSGSFINTVHNGLIHSVSGTKYSVFNGTSYTEIIETPTNLRSGNRGVAFWNNKLYVIAKQYCYSFDGTTWKQEASLPEATNTPTLFVHRNKLHVISCGNGGGHHYSYNGEWWRIEELPLWDSPYYAIVHDDKIHYIGSYSGAYELKRATATYHRKT